MPIIMMVLLPVVFSGLLMGFLFRRYQGDWVSGLLTAVFAYTTAFFVYVVAYDYGALADTALLWFLVAVALGSAGIVALIFARMQHSMTHGALIGAGIGSIGSLLVGLPLNFCTFHADTERVDVIVGILLQLLVIGILLALAVWIIRYFFDPTFNPVEGQDHAGTYSGLLTPILLLLPTLVILLFFLYYPAFETFRLSTLLVRLGAPKTKFVCVRNFTALLDGNHMDTTAFLMVIAIILIAGVVFYFKRMPAWLRNSLLIINAIVMVVFFAYVLKTDYGTVFFNTFFIAGLIVVLGLTLGLAIATLAFQPVRGASIYRTLLIWPYAISPAVAGIIFFVMFDPIAGVINHLIQLFGIQGLDWFRDPWLARAAIILTSVWKTLGFNILFYIAGLQNIPTNLIEAAAIDGANTWQRFRKIIVPLLSPITFFLIVTNISYAFFDIFGTIDYLTKGGPTGSTSVMIYEVIELGIRSKDLGKAAAQSVVLFILVIGVTYLQFRSSGKQVNYGS